MQKGKMPNGHMHSQENHFKRGNDGLLSSWLIHLKKKKMMPYQDKTGGFKSKTLLRQFKRIPLSSPDSKKYIKQDSKGTNHEVKDY